MNEKDVPQKKSFWKTVKFFCQMRSNLKKNAVINEDNATANDYKMLRSSPPEVFLEKVVLKIYCKYGGEHSC